MKQTCGNCAWARFALSPSGRKKRNMPGVCEWPEPEPTPVPFWHRSRGYVGGRNVWPDDPGGYGETCPTWKPMEGK